ncbi:MAG: hypothetical protein KGJ80_05480 [Chloroflexota bacterium]|nr:hypothetical protein [Chloroflexota bacterium]
MKTWIPFFALLFISSSCSLNSSEPMTTTTPAPSASLSTPLPSPTSTAAAPSPASANYAETPAAVADAKDQAKQTVAAGHAYTDTPIAPTATATPHDILFVNLHPEEERMLRDSLNLLKSCAPSLYDYVRSHVAVVTRGTPPENLPNASAFVQTRYSDPTVYLPEKGAVDDPGKYIDSMRTFVAAVLLVHEARHIELGKDTTEPDAYRFELQVFVPACKPNDIGDSPYTVYEMLRRYAEWRASLPYPGEPPPGVKPPR